MKNSDQEQARESVERNKQSVSRVTKALEAPEDEEHEAHLRAMAAKKQCRIAINLAYLGEPTEAQEYFHEASKSYLDYVNQSQSSSSLSLEGGDGILRVQYLLHTAILGGQEALGEEASRVTQHVEVEHIGGYSGHLAYAKALGSLVLGEDVSDELAAMETAETNADGFVTGAFQAIQGIDKNDPDRVARGIERILEWHVEEADSLTTEHVCVEALALFVLARKRSLIEYSDITTYQEYIPEYQPGIQ